MGSRLRLLAVLALVLVSPLLGLGSARGQGASCASALWLDSLATPGEATDAVPAWMGIQMTDACSGTTFTLADFAGRAMYVEAMATWCPPCREQLDRVKEAATQIPAEERAETVFVALSSEVDLPRETLAQYSVDNSFPFIFAVMPAEMLQAIADDLGQEVAVPPATPHLIVAADGSVGALRTGAEGAADILALLAEAGA